MNNDAEAWHARLSHSTRERTDLTTGSELAPIYVHRIRADLLKDR